MEEEESHYVSQLREVYNSCDTTGTGFLDRDELTQLCLKLHLEKKLPLLLQTLLGKDHFARVNFEEFKEGFVALLSSAGSLEGNTSSLQSAVPGAVPPKYVSGSKWYGRRSLPESCDSVAGAKCLPELPSRTLLRSQLRRAASLESVESLKSDEDAESLKEPQNELFEAQGQLPAWGSEVLSSPQKSCSRASDSPESHVWDIWQELGVGSSGHLTKQELAVLCQSIGLQALDKEELEDLFSKLDQDGDGRVSLEEFQRGLFSHGPVSLPDFCTSVKPSRPWSHYQVLEEGSCHTATTSSLVSLCSGPRLLCSLDDGAGFAFPEQLIALWAQEGIQNGAEILQSLDFSVDEKVNLLELTWALENELVTVSGATQQAALACYRQELNFRQGQAEQMVKERDKARQDLERAEKRNLEFVKEMDDCHTALEQLAERKIKHLEQDYRERLSLLRAEVEVEREVLWEQALRQSAALESNLEHLRAQEAGLREKLTLALKENSRLQKDITELVGKLSESEKLVLKLQKDLESLLRDKLEPQSTELLAQEEQFAEIIQEYKCKCRDLQDQNDELQTALEGLKARLPLSPRGWPHTQSDGQLLLGHGPAVSIEMEIMLEQVKEHYQDLRIQLETKVNRYEREMEAMKRDFALERKEMERVFRLKVQVLEHQKADLEVLLGRSQALLCGLQDQLRGRPPGPELQRAELEQQEQQRRPQDEVPHIREAVEVELSAELSGLAAWQAAHCVTASRQHQQDALLEVRPVTEQLHLERGWREQQEAEPVACAMQQQPKPQELCEGQAQCCKAFELTRQEQVQRLMQEAEMLHALLKDGPVGAEAGQARIGSPVPICAPVKVAADGRCDRAPARSRDSLMPHGPPESPGPGVDGSGILQAEQLALVPAGCSSQVDPCGVYPRVALEGLVRSTGSLVCLNLPETPELLLGTEHGLGSTQPEAPEPQLRPSDQGSYETQERQPAPRGSQEESPLGQVQESPAGRVQLSSPEPRLQSLLGKAEGGQPGLPHPQAAWQGQLQPCSMAVLESEEMRARLLQLEDIVRTLEQDAVSGEGIRKEIEVLRRAKEKACCAVEELSKQNQKYEAELSQLSIKLLQLRKEASAQQVQNKKKDSTIQLLRERLKEARGQEELQEEREKQLKATEAQAEELGMVLKNAEVLLQDRVGELKEQLGRNTRAELLTELYLENAHLMRQLQVTEGKQRSAERSVRTLEEKVRALNRLLGTISAASLSV